MKWRSRPVHSLQTAPAAHPPRCGSAAGTHAYQAGSAAQSSFLIRLRLLLYSGRLLAGRRAITSAGADLNRKIRAKLAEAVKQHLPRVLVRLQHHRLAYPLDIYAIALKT